MDDLDEFVSEGGGTRTTNEQLDAWEARFQKFRRGLRKEHKKAIDDLWLSAHKHIAATSNASPLMSFDFFLLSAWLEDHAELMHLRTLDHDVMRLRGEVEFLRRQLKARND